MSRVLDSEALSSADVRSRYGPTVREALGEDRGS